MEGKLFGQRYLYLIGLLLLVTGLPLSYFLTSVSQFFLAASFFLEGNMMDKWKRFFANRFALLFTGIFLLHVIGMLWTSDLNEGWRDIRIKLPLLVLPVILAGSVPLDQKRYNIVLRTFVAAVLLASLVIFAVLIGIIHHPFKDIHEVFIFKISHIRFSLFICLAIFILWQSAFSENQKSVGKFVAAIITIWFVFFMIKVESLTGLIVMMMVVFLLALRFVMSSISARWKMAILLFLAFSGYGMYRYLSAMHREVLIRHPFTYNSSDKTRLGNSYFFNLNDSTVENGYRMWIYVCEPELRTSWNELSEVKYDSLDRRNQELKYTLIRYLTSKGWRKDAEAVQRLSADEVQSIENGIANVDYRKTSDLRARVKQVMWEVEKYKEGANPSGHSVTQRLEFWRAALGIISENPLMGVGTGDLKSAYAIQYEKIHSQLDADHRLRAHNQYMSIFAAFGVFGFLYVLFALIYCWSKNRHHLLFSIFMIILALSMLTEDTLETQPGATFAALFFCLFLFVRPEIVRGSSVPPQKA